ncbi:MAG TPA: hypothetical protein VFB06_10455 [Streptosporangiaceae bacterium]|nr:hypothetical protein [Streptosporangiaceae bacterium]
MNGTVTGIWIMCAVIVVSLAIWLGFVARAARRPGSDNRHVQPMRGLVQGGEHMGGGRSVMPRRDAPVPEGGGNPPSAEEMAEAAEDRAAHREQSGSPMDL